MKFATEKRLLLGVLAWLAPLPLPLNEPRPTGVIGWGALACYLLAVGWFLYRVRRGDHRPLGRVRSTCSAPPTCLSWCST